MVPSSTLNNEVRSDGVGPISSLSKLSRSQPSLELHNRRDGQPNAIDNLCLESYDSPTATVPARDCGATDGASER